MAYKTRSDTLQLQRLIECLEERGSESASTLKASAQPFLDDVKPKYKPGDIPHYDGTESDDCSSYVEGQENSDDDWDDGWEEWEDCSEEPIKEATPPPPLPPPKEPTPTPPPKEPTPPPPPKDPTPPPPAPVIKKPEPAPYKPAVLLSGVEKSSDIASPLMKFPTLPVSIPNLFGSNATPSPQPTAPTANSNSQTSTAVKKQPSPNEKKKKRPVPNEAVETVLVDTMTVAAAVAAPNEPSINQVMKSVKEENDESVPPKPPPRKGSKASISSNVSVQNQNQLPQQTDNVDTTTTPPRRKKKLTRQEEIDLGSQNSLRDDKSRYSSAKDIPQAVEKQPPLSNDQPKSSESNKNLDPVPEPAKPSEPLAEPKYTIEAKPAASVEQVKSPEKVVSKVTEPEKVAVVEIKSKASKETDSPSKALVKHEETKPKTLESKLEIIKPAQDSSPQKSETLPEVRPKSSTIVEKPIVTHKEEEQSLQSNKPKITEVVATTSKPDIPLPKPTESTSPKPKKPSPPPKVPEPEPVPKKDTIPVNKKSEEPTSVPKLKAPSPPPKIAVPEPVAKKDTIPVTNKPDQRSPEVKSESIKTQSKQKERIKAVAVPPPETKPQSVPVTPDVTDALSKSKKDNEPIKPQPKPVADVKVKVISEAATPKSPSLKKKDNSSGDNSGAKKHVTLSLPTDNDSVDDDHHTRMRSPQPDPPKVRRRPKQEVEPQPQLSYNVPDDAKIPKVGGQRSKKPTLASQWRKQKQKQKQEEQGIQDRLDTFNEAWPFEESDENVPKISDLAESGFFFLGLNDCVQCASCEIILSGWQNMDKGDDPWLQHARTSPGCPFLDKTKGSDWVQEILNQ